MSYYCDPCERWFNTANSYNQHMDYSPAHNQPDFECSYCDRLFSTENSLHQHCSSAAGHPYCSPCRRMFMNMNNLMQHQHSRTHMGSNMQCPFCKTGFATASAVTIHLESGTCSSGLNRTKINNMVQRMDRNNVITKPMLTMPGYDRVEMFATERAWNGSYYECYLCHRDFSSLRALNQHVQSPAHEQNIYHCPNAGCGRNYKLLSGLIQHVESESCGLMRFAQVQQQAKKGIQNMVGRMITG